jgi:REP element-mobilizing transposase RayT
MPCYLFTFHAYRSWNADHPRGFVLEAGTIEPPNANQARFYNNQAKQPRVTFGPFHQRVMIWITYDACVRRNWRLHAVATESTHIHILASWRSDEPWREISRRLKVLSSLMLGRKMGKTGRKWFVRKGSRKRVRDRTHFDYLMDSYLPKHRGLRWREGDAPPEEPPPCGER